MTQKLIRCFLGTDLRCQHDGLTKLAHKQKVDVDKLKPGQHIIFINNALNKLKMYSSGNILSYLRLPNGRIDLNTLGDIPRAFGSDMKTKYTSALKKQIERKLKR